MNNNENCISLLVDQVDCTTDYECLDLFDISECEDGTCSCEYSYYMTEDGLNCELLYIGNTSCTDDSLCQDAVPTAECQDGICQCSFGYLVSANSNNCEQAFVQDLARLTKIVQSIF